MVLQSNHTDNVGDIITEHLQMEQGNTDTMVLTGAGNVGIGITSPIITICRWWRIISYWRRSFGKMNKNN